MGSADSPSLTNVLVWRDNRYVRITAEEAIKEWGGYKISASRRVFFCGRCMHAVTLMPPDTRRRCAFFMHNSGDEEKNCPERITGTASRPLLTKAIFPQKMICRDGLLSFQLGILSIREENSPPHDLSVTVTDEYGARLCRYGLDRFVGRGLRYIDVGSVPVRRFQIQVNPKSRFCSDWPNEVEGYDPKKSYLFNTSSFKRLPDDADVTLHAEYLVLTREWLCKPSLEVDVEEISLKTEKLWRVYRICAKEYSREAASFFMRFHARLTARPVKMIPFWPLITKFPYEIVHETPNLYFFIEGEEIQPNIFSKDSAKCLIGSSTDEHYRLTALKTSGKRLLVSAGRYTVLKFTFIEQGKLACYGSKPTLNLQVRTIDGVLIEEDDLTQAPPNHEIKIRADYRSKLSGWVH